MNKPILFASISAIVLLSSIQIAFATLDCYKQGALDGHRLAFNDTTSAHCGPLYIVGFNQHAYH